MSKKEIIIFICITISVLVIIIVAGIMIISPTAFSTKENTNDEYKPQIADEIEGLELIGSEEEIKEEVVLETSENETHSEYNIPSTSSDYNVWEDLGLPDPTAGMEDDEYLEHEEILFDDPIEVEDDKELTESIFYLNNPAYLSGETNIGTNGFYNLYECIEDYFDYYFPNEPKEYEGTVVEGSYKDKGDYRSFLLEVYKEDGTTWLIECDYVVSMNYYEFFCDDINPRPRTGED